MDVRFRSFVGEHINLISEIMYLILGFNLTPIHSVHQNRESLRTVLGCILTEGVQMAVCKHVQLKARVIIITCNVGCTSVLVMRYGEIDHQVSGLRPAGDIVQSKGLFLLVI